jgi:D-glycero-alpha-D-manno-heptose-7-phosphate kinase
MCQKVSEIRHSGVRAVLQNHLNDRGLEIHHDGDLPARSGLGSSSSFIVGLLNAVSALKGQMSTRLEVALEAIRIEQEVLGETVGVQDQMMASFGGLQHLRFARSGSLSAAPLFPPIERIRQFEDHLMFIFTGQARTSSEIAKQYVPSLLDKSAVLSQYDAMVEEGIQILHSQNRAIEDFGALLHEGWLLKRSLSSVVSNPAIDSIYDEARRCGALGGKLLGAGGGGFMMLFAPPDVHFRIRESLHALIEVPVQIDNGGSQVIFFDRQQDYFITDGARVIS